MLLVEDTDMEGGTRIQVVVDSEDHTEEITAIKIAEDGTPHQGAPSKGIPPI
jgi:hypothetical protein